MGFPPAPSYGSFRLASADDIFRIGVVAVSGFYYSPLFTWMRPHHVEFPEDTLLDFRMRFQRVMKDPEYVVLVAEDYYDPQEHTKTKAIIPPHTGSDPTEGDRVIVGVASWKLEPGSKRVGQFQDDNESHPDLGVIQKRDEDQSHLEAFIAMAEPVGKNFHGMSELYMLVVHPAYWNRGHGSKLVRWGLELANVDSVTQWVMGVGKGVKLYPELGFKSLEDLHLDGDEVVPVGCSFTTAVYEPKKQAAKAEV